MTCNIRQSLIGLIVSDAYRLIRMTNKDTRKAGSYFNGNDVKKIFEKFAKEEDCIIVPLLVFRGDKLDSNAISGILI